jgi:hypothetical protein
MLNLKSEFSKLILLIILLLSNFCKAQINNNSFYFVPKTDTISQFTFDFQSFSYFHNREYFGKIADGYTLFGNNISPSLIYKPAKNVSIQLGAFARKDFGNSGFKDLQPTFTVLIEKDSTEFRFGNIKGNLAHQLNEPLYNFEGIINNALESGFQLTNRKKEHFFDLWVDWQRMIYQNSPYKEEIWGGTHWKPTIYKGSNITFKTPIQLTAYHKGGQITLDNRPLKTELNIAIGLETEFKLNGFFKKINLQNYFLGYKQQSNEIREYKSGLGYYLNATFENRKFNTMFSYYFGNSVSSFSGGSLYQSINKNDGFATEKYRKLLIMRIYKDFQIIPNLSLVARFEPYYDLNNARFEHSEGLFINYKQKFGLGKK